MRCQGACLAVGAAALISSAASSALDFTLGMGPSTNCASPGVSLRAAALTYLEPAPVLLADKYGGRHYDPSDGDNLGVGYGYVDLTAPLGSSCIGLFYRMDFTGTATRDTLDAVVSNHARKPFQVGRVYELGIDSSYFEAVGVKASRVLSFTPAEGWSVSTGITGSFMKALTSRTEYLRGNATAVSSRYAVGTATWSRAWSDYDLDDFNPFVAKANPRGYGYSVDVDVSIRSPIGLTAQFTAMDAWSRVSWQNVPRSDKRADNETIRYDANLNRQAFIQGLDRRVDVDYTIDPRYRLALSMPLRTGLTVMLSDDYIWQTHFPAVGVTYDWKNRTVAASVDTQTGALGLAFQQGWLYFSVTADEMDVQRASVLGAALGFSHRW